MPLRLLVRLLTLEAIRALLRNKIRSGLAILGIMVAVATVILVIALGHAGVAAAEAELDKLGDNLVWVEAGSRNAAGVRSGNHGMNTLTAQDAQAIRDEVPLIALVSEQVDGNLQVIGAERNWQTRFRGVSPAYLTIKKWEIAEGAFFTQDQVDHGDRVIVIGDTVRRQLFGDAPAVGEQIRAQNVWFAIVGVLAPKGVSASGQDQDDTTMLPWTTARTRLLGKDIGWLDDILCSAVAPESIPHAGRQIADLLRDRHHIQPGADDDFNIRHPEELLKARIKSSSTLQLLFLIIASISMIVGGIGVMNVMLASVAQRTVEIGIRGAIGAKPSAIRVQFLAEAVMLTSIGGLLGLALAGLGVPVVESNLGWHLILPTAVCIGSVVAAIGLGIVFGYYPASRAARLDPIEALRKD